NPGWILKQKQRAGILCRRGPMGAGCQPISDVQWAQRVALRGIADRQKGQSLVVGSGAGASFSRCRRLIALISRNTAKATMMKLTRAFMNRPKLRVTAPAALAAAR